MQESIILTSNGLTSNTLIDYFKSLIIQCNYKKAIIITTASVGFKEKDYHVPGIVRLFNESGLSSDFIDIEFDNPERLKDFDVIYILGGNPYHLLNQFKKNKCKEIFEYLLSNNKLIITVSAGSMALTAGIYIVEEFTPELNDEYQIKDLNGLELFNFHIFPHYSKFKLKFENFDQRINCLESKLGLIEKCNDGEAILCISDSNYRKI